MKFKKIFTMILLTILAFSCFVFWLYEEQKDLYKDGRFTTQQKYKSFYEIPAIKKIKIIALAITRG